MSADLAMLAGRHSVCHRLSFERLNVVNSLWKKHYCRGEGKIAKSSSLAELLVYSRGDSKMRRCYWQVEGC